MVGEDFMSTRKYEPFRRSGHCLGFSEIPLLVIVQTDKIESCGDIPFCSFTDQRAYRDYDLVTDLGT